MKSKAIRFYQTALGQWEVWSGNVTIGQIREESKGRIWVAFKGNEGYAAPGATLTDVQADIIGRR